MKTCEKVYEIEKLENVAFDSSVGLSPMKNMWKNYVEVLKRYASKKPAIKTIVYCKKY